MLAKVATSLLLASGLAMATPTPTSQDEFLEDPHVLVSRQAGALGPNLTIEIDPAFPTDVGYPGKVRYGAAPFLAQYNPLNSSIPNDGLATDARRYEPLDAQNSSDSSSSGSASSETFDMYKYWGNTSPWFPSPAFPEAQKYRQINQSCQITNVHILHRHGARYPTSYSTEGAPFFGATVANASAAAASGGPAFNNSGPLEFLNTWSYRLGAELLTPDGAQMLFDSGIKAYYDYGSLYNKTAGGNGTAPPKPVFRTTSQERILDSARYWTAGFFGLDAPDLVNMVVEIEESGFNSTLASYDTCNNTNVDANNVGDAYLNPMLLQTINGTRERLQQYTSLNLTNDLVYGMMSLCPYETAAFGYSPFCQIFTKSDWEFFNYYLTLQFSGDYGPMSPSGRAQGIGYAQELLARLTQTPINMSEITTQNTTLLTPEYFPLNQSIEVSFSHDDILVSVLTALNYTQLVGGYLNASYVDNNATFVLSQVAPFAGRIIWEVATCGGDSTNGSSGNGTQIIRTIVNDALVPMDEGQGCTPREDGACLLSEFTQYQSETAYKAANFDYACFGNYSLTGPTISNGTISA